MAVLSLFKIEPAERPIVERALKLLVIGGGLAGAVLGYLLSSRTGEVPTDYWKEMLKLIPLSGLAVVGAVVGVVRGQGRWSRRLTPAITAVGVVILGGLGCALWGLAAAPTGRTHDVLVIVATACAGVAVGGAALALVYAALDKVDDKGDGV